MRCRTRQEHARGTGKANHHNHTTVESAKARENVVVVLLAVDHNTECKQAKPKVDVTVLQRSSPKRVVLRVKVPITVLKGVNVTMTTVLQQSSF